MSISGLSIAPELVPHFHFSPRVGRLELFKNFCPMGCFGPRDEPFRENQPVYVNHKGNVEKFKNVHMPEDSHRKSYVRIEHIVKKTFQEADGSRREELYRSVQEKANIDIESERRLRRSLTYDKIVRIERAINQVARESRVPASPISPRILRDERGHRII